MQDKTAVPWGRQNSFGVRCFPSTPVHNVEKIFDGRRYAAQPLTAILQGGSIKRWKSAYVWDSPPKADTCQDEVSDTSQDEVSDAPDTTYGFRAAPPSELQDVVKLQANQHGWVAIKTDGSLTTWGWPAHESLNETWKCIPSKYMEGPFKDVATNMSGFAAI